MARPTSQTSTSKTNRKPRASRATRSGRSARSPRSTRASRPIARSASRSRTRKADPAIQRFLEGFTQALTSGDGRAAAACFEYPSLMVMSAVGEYGGTTPIRDADEAATFFEQAPQQYHAKGIEETFPDVEEVQWLAHDLALVKAHFPYMDADGNDLGDGETSVYVVRKDGNDHRIGAAITLGTDSDRQALRPKPARRR
jgi:hypothetical protein